MGRGMKGVRETVQTRKGMRGKRLQRKVLEREDNRGAGRERGRKWGHKKRPSEQERQRGRAERFSFVVVGE